MVRRVTEIDRASEAQLMAHDDVARIRDRMANDGDFLAAGWRRVGHGELALRTSASGRPLLRLRFTKG